MAEQSKTKRWSNTAVTDSGNDLLTEFAAGKILKITGAYGFAGTHGEDLTELSELPDGREHPLTIESVVKTDNSVSVCIQVTSIGNPEPYKMEAIGITAAARDPGDEDDSGAGLWDDKLLMVIEDTEDENGSRGVTIPAESDQLYTFKLYAVLSITNKERLEVSVSSVGIATIGAIQDAMDQHNADPDAHAGTMADAVSAHNADPDAHPSLTARARGLELALNGSVTITKDGDPTTETKGKKDQHYINTETGEEFVCTDDQDGTYTWEKIDYEDEKKKSLREALEEAQATAKAAKDVADGAAQAIAAVQNTISVVPSQSGTLTYNKGKQKPSWNNLALEMMDITYGEDKTSAEDFQGETDAGTYKAYVKPKEGYTWGDKSTEEKEITWTIQRATIATVPSVSGALTYNESPQAPTWNNYDAEKLTKEETPQTDAGEHSTTFTPTKNYQWSGGDTTGKVVKWTIGRAALAAVPSQNGTPTYTGSPLTPNWNNYEEKKLTLGGTLSATDAGNYTATATPTKNYQWSDGSTAAKNISWTIGKAAGSLTLDKSKIALNTTTKFDTITVTRAGNGTISASSSDNKVATAEVSGNTVLVTSVGDGTAKITVKVAEGKNHTAPADQTCDVTVSIPKIYGVSWDGTAATTLSRTDAAEKFTNPVPYVKGASSYSSPFDNLSPWKDMVRVTDSQAGEMVKIPKFWYKLTQVGTKGVKIQIADKATDGFSVCPACMDRGDGKGERDYVLVGRYHCATNTYKSTTGVKPQASVAQANFRTNIHNLGTNVYMMDFATRFTIWLLYIVEFADWNSQKTIGKGCGNNSGTENMGYTDSMPYHTGTTQASRDTYGLGTQYRYIEGLWDNVYDRLTGCYNASTGLMVEVNPSKFAENSGGVSVGTPANGWIMGLKVSTSGPFPCFINSDTSGGGEAAGVCDYWYFNASNPVVFVGGYYSQVGNRGMFFVNCTTLTYTSAYHGSRVLILP